MTLKQLRVFLSVARADSLTGAAKDLGLAQPTLSQLIQRLEETLDMRLFERRSNKLQLTEAGQYLLREAEPILGQLSDLEGGLAEFSAGRRQTLRIAGLNSVLRLVLPRALQHLRAQLPQIEVDVHEAAPSAVLDMLYERRVNIGLVSANSIAQNSMGFQQHAIMEDPYVLAVPAQLDLGNISSPARQLAPEHLSLLNSTIRFVFGTQYDAKVDHWFQQVLPRARPIAHCRTFEVAMGMVQAGLGIALLPALSAFSGGASGDGVRLYRVNTPPRRIVALVPAQLRRVEPYTTLLEALERVGSEYALPAIEPAPPFLNDSRFVSA